MFGDMIHLIFCQIIKSGQLQLQSLHATFDGAYEQMTEKRKYWDERPGFKTTGGNAGGFTVYDSDNEPVRYYFVSSRTIDR